MKFECSFMNWDTLQWERQTITAKRKLKDRWREMYRDIFEKRPRAKFVVQPTVSGLYTLERII